MQQPGGDPLGPAAVGLGVADVVEVDPELPLAADEGDVLAVDDHHVVPTVVERVVDGLEGSYACDICIRALTEDAKLSQVFSKADTHPVSLLQISFPNLPGQVEISDLSG